MRLLLEALKGAAILMISPPARDHALPRLEGTRLPIQIDLKTAEHVRLRIGSKLLGLAEIVKRQQ